MDEKEKMKKVKQSLLKWMLLCWAFTILCVGFVLFKAYEKNNKTAIDISDGQTTIYQIIVMIGVFFFVISVCYLLPSFIKASKGDFGMRDDKNMQKAFHAYLPDGETITAGIYAVGKSSEFNQTFGKCFLEDDLLLPGENGTTIAVKKVKRSTYDVYIGITQHHLLVAECEKNKHLYDISDLGNCDAPKLENKLAIQDIGICFPLTDVEKIEVKKGIIGSFKCSISLKNKSFLKIMIPRSAGYGMPCHNEYSKAIIEQLNQTSCRKN